MFGNSSGQVHAKVRPTPQPTELIATVLFAAAVLHTFAAKQIHGLGEHFPRHAGISGLPTAAAVAVFLLPHG